MGTRGEHPGSPAADRLPEQVSVPQAEAAGSRDRIWEWESGPRRSGEGGKGRDGAGGSSPFPGRARTGRAVASLL